MQLGQSPGLGVVHSLSPAPKQRNSTVESWSPASASAETLEPGALGHLGTWVLLGQVR